MDAARPPGPFAQQLYNDNRALNKASRSIKASADRTIRLVCQRSFSPKYRCALPNPLCSLPVFFAMYRIISHLAVLCFLASCCTAVRQPLQLAAVDHVQPLSASFSARKLLQGCAPGTFEWPAGSGYCWWKKDAAWFDPGPNKWSPDNVAVAADGALELKVSGASGGWASAEAVLANKNLGLGDYIVTFETPPEAVHKALVGAAFVYAGFPKEIDIMEYSRWNEADSAANGQYVIQPWWAPNSRNRIHLQGASITHRMRWGGTTSPNQVMFESWSADGKLLSSWVGQGGDNFTPGGDQVILNHWIYKSAQDIATNNIPLPADFPGSTFRVRCFTFCPLGNAGCTPMGQKPKC